MRYHKKELATRLKRYAPAALVVATFTPAFVPNAYAMDTTEVVNTIKGASTAVDSVGLAIIAVVTGMVVIGLIVGMLMRKGK